MQSEFHYFIFLFLDAISLSHSLHLIMTHRLICMSFVSSCLNIIISLYDESRATGRELLEESGAEGEFPPRRMVGCRHMVYHRKWRSLENEY